VIPRLVQSFVFEKYGCFGLSNLNPFNFICKINTCPYQTAEWYLDKVANIFASTNAASSDEGSSESEIDNGRTLRVSVVCIQWVVLCSLIISLQFCFKSCFYCNLGQLNLSESIKRM